MRNGSDIWDLVNDKLDEPTKKKLAEFLVDEYDDFFDAYHTDSKAAEYLTHVDEHYWLLAHVGSLNTKLHKVLEAIKFQYDHNGMTSEYGEKIIRYWANYGGFEDKLSKLLDEASEKNKAIITSMKWKI